MTPLQYDHSSKLNRAQAVLVCVLIGTGLVGAYYLGLSAGRATGIEVALGNCSDSSTKLALPDTIASLSDNSEKDEALVGGDVLARIANEKIPQPIVPNEKEALDAELPMLRPKVLEPATSLDASVNPTPVPATTPTVPLKPANAAKGKKAEEPEKTPTEQFAKLLDDRANELKKEKLTPTPAAPPQAIFTPAPSLHIDERKSTDLSSGWYAQVSASPVKSEADGLATKLRSGGFPVVVERTSVKGKYYYRILVGPESDRTMAESLVGELRREPYISSRPFVRVVR